MGLWAGLLRDGRDEVVLPRARGLDVFGAHFEDFFEIDAYVCQFALEQHYDVLVVFAFLPACCLAGSSLCTAALDGLQITDLLVETCQILLDHVGELGDLDGSVIEECLPLGQLA